MAGRKTPGQLLIETLNESLPDNVEWDPRERVVLGLIEESADRLDVLKRRFDAEAGKPQTTGLSTGLASEIRRHEGNIARLVESLDPNMARQPKSQQHQNAAYSRWHRGLA